LRVHFNAALLVSAAGLAPRIGRRGVGGEGALALAAASSSDGDGDATTTLDECCCRRRRRLSSFAFPRLSPALSPRLRIGDRGRQGRRRSG